MHDDGKDARHKGKVLLQLSQRAATEVLATEQIFVLHVPAL